MAHEKSVSFTMYLIIVTTYIKYFIYFYRLLLFIQFYRRTSISELKELKYRYNI